MSFVTPAETAAISATSDRSLVTARSFPVHRYDIAVRDSDERPDIEPAYRKERSITDERLSDGPHLSLGHGECPGLKDWLFPVGNPQSLD